MLREGAIALDADRAVFVCEQRCAGRDGDEIPDLIAVETDGFNPSMPQPTDTKQTLLAASPYTDSRNRGRAVHNTSLCENHQGTLVFVAGTFH
ncbi:N,N-dimethylformamidase beta subunit family domain-containing protein [[Kitasatospora] papulosa]